MSTNNCVTVKVDRANIIYIAGPMTGIENYNFPEFNKAAEKFIALGYIVENPADHGVVDGAEWQDYLSYDISRLGLCGVIYMLDGWKKSKGANLEFYIANTIGMKIIYQSEEQHAIT